MAKTKDAIEKEGRNKEIARLFNEGMGRPELARRYKGQLSEGGMSSLLDRLRKKGLITGRKKVREIPKRGKVEIVKRGKREKEEKPKREEEQRIAEQKIKKGFMIHPDTWKKIMLYRVNHSDQSFSEIVEKAILKFLKEK